MSDTSPHARESDLLERIRQLEEQLDDYKSGRHTRITIERTEYNYIQACVSYAFAQERWREWMRAKDFEVDRHSRATASENERVAWMEMQQAYKLMSRRRLEWNRQEEESEK